MRKPGNRGVENRNPPEKRGGRSRRIPTRRRSESPVPREVHIYATRLAVLSWGPEWTRSVLAGLSQMMEEVGSGPQTTRGVSSLLCALLSERCQCECQCQCQCRRIGYGVLGHLVAYIARACYMTKTDGVCLSCCPSASTPVVARLLVRYWQGSAAVGSPSSVRTGTRAVGSFGGVVERSSSGVRIDSEKDAARGRSRLPYQTDQSSWFERAFRGKASRTQAYQAC